MWCFLYYLSVLITVGKRLLGLHMSKHLTLKSNSLSKLNLINDVLVFFNLKPHNLKQVVNMMIFQTH